MLENFDKFYTKALKFLSFRPRSEKEISDYLIKKKADINLVNSIIEKLKIQKFLNDLEFAKWWIEQRTEFKPKGLRLIELELKQKGISKDLIDELRIKNYELWKDDLTKAKELLEKYRKRFEGLDRQKIYQRAGGFLGRRGFDWETIKSAIDHVYGAKRG